MTRSGCAGLALLVLAGCGREAAPPAAEPTPAPSGALACVTDEPVTRQPIPDDLRGDVVVDARFAILKDGGPTDYGRTYYAHAGDRVTVVTGARCRGAWVEESGPLRRVKEQPSRDRPGDLTAVLYEVAAAGESRVLLRAAFRDGDPCDDAGSSRTCPLVATLVLAVA
ncbi:MAG TPA: hypothetical protein VGX28_09840 [Frankiaceae bacterium]|nr:hypothetical protein [Frankiaceae bacterium]